MNDALMFGATYRLEGQTVERLEKDMELMAKAGMNTIRVSQPWGAQEPKNGEFRFDSITRMLKAAGGFDLNVIVVIPTHTVPRWMELAHPDLVEREGTEWRLDFTNAAYLQFAERLVRKLVARTATYPNVCGYQLDDETAHGGICSARAVQGFREWLEERFQTVERLERALMPGSAEGAVESFAELPDPAEAAHPGYRAAFERYRRRLVTEFLKWEAEIVSKYKREDQFVTHNFGFSLRPSGPFPGDEASAGIPAGSDPFGIAKNLSFAAGDILCETGDRLTGEEISFCGDLLRTLRGERYLVMEAQAEGTPGSLPYPGQLRLMALAHLASGASGLLYHPWASAYGGAESLRGGVVGCDRQQDALYQEIQATGALFARIAPELAGFRKENRVGIVVSADALCALSLLPAEREPDYHEVVGEFHAALSTLNVECDVLYERNTAWASYSLLIFPQLYAASEDTVARVKEYVSKGGTILATCRSFYADENLRSYADLRPHGLAEVFGMHFTRVTRSEDGRWMELLEPDRAATAGRYDHRHWNGAAATRNRYGGGQAWYLGTRLEPGDLKDFLNRVLAAAELPVPSLQYPLVMRRGVNAEGKGLRFLMNFSPEPLRFRCPTTGTDLISGSFFSTGGEIGLLPWDAAILREE